MEPVMTLQIIRNMIFDFQEFLFFSMEKFMMKSEEDKKKNTEPFKLSFDKKWLRYFCFSV